MATNLNELRKVVRFQMFGERSEMGLNLGNTHTIKCIDEINYQDENGNLVKRTIRYIPGEMSIFADEQPTINNLPTPHERDRRIYRLLVKDNVFFVANSDVNLLKYLRLCNANAGNELRNNNYDALFYEFNPEDIAKKSIDKETDRIKAEYSALSMAISDAEAVLMSLSENPNYTKSLLTKSVEEKRADALAAARTNPEKFLAAMNSKSQKNKYLINRAIAYKVVVQDTYTLKFTDGDVLIIRAPSGQNPVDLFAERVDRDATLMEKFELMKERTRVAAEMKEASNLEVSDDPIKELYTEAKKAGLVSHKSLKIHYTGYEGDMEWKNMRAFLNDLEDNEKLRNEIIERLQRDKQTA